MRHRNGVAWLAALAVAPAFGVRESSAADQAVANLAVVESANRLAEASFVSAGPVPEIGVASNCMGGLDVPTQLDELDGETARVIGDQFVMFGAASEAEVVTVNVFIVDEAHVSSLDWFVALLGEEATADCRRAELTPVGPTGSTAVLVDVQGTSDLDIGALSARLDVRTATVAERSTQQLTATYVAARSGRALVVVLWAMAGEDSISGFDAQEELAAVVGALEALD